MLDVCSCCGTLHFSSARVSPSKSARQAARRRRHGMARMLLDARVCNAASDMGNQTIRTTGAWCTLSPVLRTGTCARLCVLRVWCLLSGQICYTEFCPGTSLNNTTVGSPISKQCYLLVQNFRPSHEERIVGTLASTPLVLGPLPVGAGPHQAEAAWAPPTPHRLRPAGVPWERRRGWLCADFAVKRRALRGGVA